MSQLIANLMDIYYQDHGEDHPLISQNSLSDFLYVTASTMLFFLFSLFGFSVLAFIFNGSINVWLTVCALIATVLFHFYYARKVYEESETYSIAHNAKARFNKFILFSFVSLCFAALTVYVSLYVAGLFYDFSYDGQAYHQEMVMTLYNGWNPFVQILEKEDTIYWKWLNVYPKAIEVIQTHLYIISSHIEESKAVSFIYAAIAFFYSVAFFLKGKNLNLITSILFALLLILNPVAIYQSASFYNDGILYFAFLSLFFILIYVYTHKKNYPLATMIISIILLSNIKTTGLVYSVILMTLFHGIVWYSSKIRLALKIFFTSVLGYVLAFFLFGFSPYILNSVHHGHPLYPAAGADKYDYAALNAPESIANKTAPERFLISLFSKTTQARSNRGTVEIKTPFTYTEDEIPYLTTSGVTIGGFGVYFSGAFLMSLVSLVFLLKFGDKRKNKFLLVILFIIMLTTLINPASYYARYVPQFWLFPASVAIYSLVSKKMGLRFLGVLLYLIMILNSLFISSYYFPNNLQNSKELRRQLSVLSLISDRNNLKVDFDVFESNKMRFTEAGINYKEVDGESCKSKRILVDMIEDADIRICLN